MLTNTTSYPIDQSLGSSWDPDLVYRVASQIGDEAREVSPDNRLNLDFYSPTMNLERDPRWGRNDEAYGEDPLLVTRLVSQFVNGMEGKDKDGKLLPGANGFHKTATTLKHYAANNSEVNRLTGSSDMDDRTLREYYTHAFRGIVQASQPGSVMSSYNRVNGVPAAADPYLIDTLLRQTFGFDGYVTSDCDAIFTIAGNDVRGHHWQPPGYDRPVNNTERNAFAMAAGEDANCQTGYRDNYNYLNQLPTARRPGHPDADRHVQRQRPRRLAHAPVHGAHGARRVRPARERAVGDRGARPRPAGELDQLRRQRRGDRRRRRGSRSPARPGPRASCCSRTTATGCRSTSPRPAPSRSR